MKEFGMALIILGIALVVAGIFLLCAGHLPFNLGRLPGDINIKGEKSAFHFPIATCIIASIILAFIVNIILRLLKK
jgi:hypothetical protein